MLAGTVWQDERHETSHVHRAIVWPGSCFPPPGPLYIYINTYPLAITDQHLVLISSTGKCWLLHLSITVISEVFIVQHIFYNFFNILNCRVLVHQTSTVSGLAPHEDKSLSSFISTSLLRDSGEICRKWSIEFILLGCYHVGQMSAKSAWAPLYLSSYKTELQNKKMNVWYIL